MTGEKRRSGDMAGGLMDDRIGRVFYSTVRSDGRCSATLLYTNEPLTDVAELATGDGLFTATAARRDEHAGS